jgi:aminopeptidase
VIHVSVDDCRDPEASAEGAHLALWSYDALKSKKDFLSKLEVLPIDQNKVGSDWLVGKRKAIGQNLARTLMESPSNVMTPTQFARVTTFF